MSRFVEFGALAVIVLVVGVTAQVLSGFTPDWFGALYYLPEWVRHNMTVIPGCVTDTDCLALWGERGL